MFSRQQPPYQLTRKQWRKIRQPDYVVVAWRISFFICLLCVLALVVASFF